MRMQQKPLLTDEYGGLLSPDKPFDPKAFTRQTWRTKKKKKQPDGLLVSFNVHPDAYVRPPMILGKYRIITPGTKNWIKWIRVVQLAIRILQLVAAIGILFLFIVLTKVPTITSWILRVAAGFTSLQCSYSIYHNWRIAGGRSPASSAAYQLFSFIADLAIVGIYGYGFYTVSNNSGTWSTFMSTDLLQTLLACAKYGLIGSAGSHVVTLTCAGWLAFIFNQISKLPPDMNPLRPRLTSRGRRHKKSKSSLASNSSMESLHKDIFGQAEVHRLSTQTLDELNSSRPSIPFLETFNNAPSSPTGSRDSRVSFPNRQYQITPANRTPRDSVDSRSPASGQSSPTKFLPTTTFYTPRDLSPTKSRPGTSYTVPKDYDLPKSPTKVWPSTAYTSPNKSRPSTSYDPPTPRAIPNYNRPHSPARAPKFIEAWAPTDTLIGRTQKRLNEDEMRVHRSYEALQQICDGSDDDEMMDSDEEDYNQYINQVRALPDPLRTHHPESPSGSPAGSPQRVSNHGVFETKPIPQPKLAPPKTEYRKSSIQDENEFTVKTYGELDTGMANVDGSRQVSSRDDYEIRSGAYGR